jgi:(p)ppGpp synthase/HD superfamily hydrolase
MQLTNRYKKALSFAFDLHKDDRRKGKDTPYIAHLLSVSAMVMDDGGTEDEAISGLLHDSLEDHPDQVTREILEAEFGKTVADIVQGCTDTPDDFRGGEKPPWKERKLAYINHLKDAPTAVLRVAIADKLHNARELLSDLELEGKSTIDRFNVGWDEQVWYLEELLAVFDEKMQRSLHLDGFLKTILRLKGVLGLS